MLFQIYLKAELNCDPTKSEGISCNITTVFSVKMRIFFPYNSSKKKTIQSVKSKSTSTNFIKLFIEKYRIYVR